jgi:hypothetical protein
MNLKNEMKTIQTTLFMLLAGALMTLPRLAAADLGHGRQGGAAQPGAKKAKVKPYPLATCVVSGEKLGGDLGDTYVLSQDGQEVKLCCKSCLKDFNKDVPAHMKKIAAAAKNVKPYRLDTCLVSGEKFGGDMGVPVLLVHEGREIKLCCNDCIKEFKKDPAKHIKKLEAAEKQIKK